MEEERDMATDAFAPEPLEIVQLEEWGEEKSRAIYLHRLGGKCSVLFLTREPYVDNHRYLHEMLPTGKRLIPVPVKIEAYIEKLELDLEKDIDAAKIIDLLTSFISLLLAHTKWYENAKRIRSLSLYRGEQLELDL